MELQLKSLIPLWTGGVKTGKLNRIHETGIVGDLTSAGRRDFPHPHLLQE